MTYEFVITAGEGRLTEQGSGYLSTHDSMSELAVLYVAYGGVLTVGPSLTPEEILSFVGATQEQIDADRPALEAMRDAM